MFGSDRSGLQSCDTKLHNCKLLTLIEEQERDLLRGRLAIDDVPHKYYVSSIHAYASGLDPLPKLRNDSPAAFTDSTSVFTYGRVYLRTNYEQQTLEAQLASEYDRIVIRD